jgi:hypothetical protein
VRNFDFDRGVRAKGGPQSPQGQPGKFGVLSKIRSLSPHWSWYASRGVGPRQVTDYEAEPTSRRVEIDLRARISGPVLTSNARRIRACEFQERLGGEGLRRRNRPEIDHPRPRKSAAEGIFAEGTAGAVVRPQRSQLSLRVLRRNRSPDDLVPIGSGAHLDRLLVDPLIGVAPC